MRIGLLTHQWPGVRLGGIGAYARLCARELGRMGHGVEVFTLELPWDVREAAEREFAGLPVRVREVKGLAARVAAGTISGEFAVAVGRGGAAVYRLVMGSLLCEAVRGEMRDGGGGLDVVEGPEYEALGLPLSWSERGAAGGQSGDWRSDKVAVAAHVHSGSAIAREVGNVTGGEEVRWREILELAAMETAHGVCAPTRQVLMDMRGAYGREAANGAEVMGLPLDVAAGEASDAVMGGAVLYVGRLEWLKGSHVLAEAANVLLERCPGARLRLAGPDTMTAPGNEGSAGGGSMKEWMRGHISNRMMDRAEFLGELGRAGIEAELKGCAFVVVPSLRENYSYVCCEALAAGRGVVVSDRTGAVEVAGEAGVSFTRGDAGALAAAMERLWKDGAECVRLGRVARERARLLSGPEVMEQRVRFYERVVERARRGDRASVRGRLRRILGEADFLRLEALMGAVEMRDGAALLRAVEGWGGKVLEATPGERVVRVLGEKGVRFWLYGAGRHSERLMSEKQLWELRGHVVAGFIDDHPRFVPDATGAAARHMGLPVMSRVTAEKRLGLGDVVVLSTDAFEEQFWVQTAGLRGRGVRVMRLYG